MNYESPDLSDEVDAPSAVAASEGITFRFEILIASLKSKIVGVLCVLVALVCAVFAVAFLYVAPLRFEIGATAYSLMPSLLVILIFAVASFVHSALTLSGTRKQAQVALYRQIHAQKRFENEWSEGFLK